MTRRLVLVLVVLAICGAATAEPAAPVAAAPAAAAPAAAAPATAAPATPLISGRKAVYILSQMRYADASLVNAAVLSECQLPQQGVELLESAARAAG